MSRASHNADEALMEKASMAYKWKESGDNNLWILHSVPAPVPLRICR